MKEMFINADNELQLPDFVTVNSIEYPAPDEARDYCGTAPQYWITVDERNISALKSWCERNNCDLFE